MAEATRTIDWRVLRAVALVFVAGRLVMLVTNQPYMDETYYWTWGQHPSLSYFDHPSLVGWTNTIASWFGWNVIALRLPVFLTLAGDLVLLMLISELIAGRGWRETFWLIAAVFLSTPIFVLLTGSALPDHLLICLSLLAVYAVERLRRAADDALDRRWLYLAGLAIGLATLTKYTGALLAVALVIYLIASPKLRVVFRSVHLYLAALLAIALQTPVLIWNIQHDFASFGFITGGRSGLREPLSFTGVSGYLLGATVVLGPLLLWPMLRFAFARNDGRDYSRIVFWLSSLVFLAASFFTNILIHWNVIAYAAVLPFVAAWFRPRWLLLAQLAYGALAIVVVFVNFTLLPVTSLVGPADRTSAWSYGWGEVAAAVAEERQTQPVGFIAGTNYVLASPLAFALRDPSVTSLGVSRDAYADWFSAEAHRGQDALIVADRIWGMDPRIAARFASVKKVRDVRVMRFGRAIDTYTIYLGKGFIPG